MPAGEKTDPERKGPRRQRLSQGLVQVYTGNGKGKTTAALGLGLRAAGHGFKVLVIQFLKGRIAYGELKAARRLSPQLTIVPMGRENFVHRENPHPLDRRWARKGWDLARRSVEGGEYDLVILDEVNVAVKFGLLPLRDLLALIRGKPGNVELVLTGRWANPAVLRLADLVTEMKEKKHYYRRGIDSRRGIER
ncbi:MAG: cob(I)yrinic acid a,c-diamide adenosyltransferase [Deltaproteobacteria bacterium]|nr:cob(I)yrinic acid a,c-diamide adenosyltransferase [Deltaproteobacteria bacterium]